MVFSRYPMPSTLDEWGEWRNPDHAATVAVHALPVSSCLSS